MSDKPDFDRLLAAVNAGEHGAYDELLPVVYDELQRLAHIHMQRESRAHTLQPTALLHEAWLRLAGSPSGELHSEDHFFGAAAEAMQRVLVDHARRRLAQKRTPPGQRVTLADLVVDDGDAGGRDYDLLALDEALAELTRHDERAARVIRMRFFAGLSLRETAAACRISEPTAKRDFRYGRAWLHERMQRGEPSD